MQKKHLIGYPITALVALGIGAAGGAGTSSPAADNPTAITAAPTVTVTAAAATVTAPAATVTAPAAPPTTVTVTAPPPAAKTSFAGDGTFQVGVDIKPGTYVSAKPDSGNCYWARLSGSGTLDDIIANNNSSGQSVVTIKPTDKFFEASGCSDWTLR
ncbi:MAG: hypothetical protein IPL43_08140 [Micropruina sp.]|nr:hypothetical protein [Micropruina sp.]